MNVKLPIQGIINEYRALPKIEPHFNSIDKLKVRTIRQIFFVGVMMYYLLAIVSIISIIIFIITLNPIIFIFPFLCLPGPISMYFTFKYIKKSPDKYFKRKLKYSVMGLFTNEYDYYIYGINRKESKKLPKPKYLALKKLIYFFVIILSFFAYLPFFISLISSPQSHMRDLFLVVCIISFFCWLPFGIWISRRIFMKRYSIL